MYGHNAGKLLPYREIKQKVKCSMVQFNDHQSTVPLCGCCIPHSSSYIPAIEDKKALSAMHIMLSHRKKRACGEVLKHQLLVLSLSQ